MTAYQVSTEIYGGFFYQGITLRWFLSIALRIPTARDFFVISAYTTREISLKLNEHGDLSFLLHNNSVHIVLLNLKEN